MLIQRKGRDPLVERKRQQELTKIQQELI